MKTKIIYISGNSSLKISEINKAFEEVRTALNLDNDIILFGVSVDKETDIQEKKEEIQDIKQESIMNVLEIKQSEYIDDSFDNYEENKINENIKQKEEIIEENEYPEKLEDLFEKIEPLKEDDEIETINLHDPNLIRLANEFAEKKESINTIESTTKPFDKRKTILPFKKQKKENTNSYHDLFSFSWGGAANDDEFEMTDLLNR